jgi:predicted ATPase
MVRKALLKNNQASSTDGMRSISFQDTRARSIRKACSLKCFRERLTMMRGGRLTTEPLQMQAMRQSAEILVENSRGVFRGQVG